MATLTKGQTFASGDTVTATKLNNLVDAATIANIVNADISASAAIAHSKLANITAGQVLLGNGSNVPTATALSGDVTVNSSGVTAIGSGVIVNADINASAAIDLSKLATGALPTAITVASANLVDGTIVNADINASAAIAHTKLANITAGSVLMGNASNAPTATALSGDVTVNSSGVTAIGSGVIVDADVNASAAIALSKLATGALPSGITVASANIVDGTIVNADIGSSAAIDHSKLANITAASILLGNATNVPTATAVTGDVTINSSGVTAIGSAAVTQAKLASGVAGTGPAFRATASGTTTINTSGVKIQLASETFDTDGKFTDSRLTPTVAGYYIVTGGAVISLGSTNSPRLEIWKNGTIHSVGAQTSGTTYSITVSDILYLDADDYIELYGRMGAGTATVAAESYGTFLSACLIRTA